MSGNFIDEILTFRTSTIPEILNGPRLAESENSDAFGLAGGYANDDDRILGVQSEA